MIRTIIHAPAAVPRGATNRRGVAVRLYSIGPLWVASSAAAMFAAAAAGTAALFAQGAIPSDALTGGAGWAGVLSSGGVLAWILGKQWPDKEKQLTDLIASNAAALKAKDAQITEMMASQAAYVEKITAQYQASVAAVVDRSATADRERRDDYKASLKTIVDSCERDRGILADALAKNFAALDSRQQRVEQRVELLVSFHEGRDPVRPRRGDPKGGSPAGGA